VRFAVVPVAIVALLAGCGGGGSHFSGRTGAPSLATTCGGLATGLHAKTYWLDTTDGVRIYAATAGDGPTAVALMHESGAGICGWLETMAWLSSKGLRAVAIAFRGYPPSAEPPDAIYHHYTPDIQAAVDAAHGLGAKHVFVMGASLGGAATVAAAPKLKEAAGVINLSGELQLPTSEIDAIGAAPRITLPFIVIGSKLDGYLDGGAAHRLYRAVGSKDKQVAVFPGGYHGWDLLEAAPYRNKVRALILGWISARE
jgi:alpha-beta hydrolase superfamily lysophospholipase